MRYDSDHNPFTTADFVTGIIGSDEILNDPRMHIAFIGRSNVGKSSTINAVLGRNKLVRSSARPGKTTEINFFEVGDQNRNEYYFVDLPGYGFARMGEKQREKLRKLILWYLLYAEVQNRKTFIVLDGQVGMTDFDQQMVELLIEHNEEVYIIANKTDRLNQKEKHALKEQLENISEGVPVILSSAVKKKGIQQIRDIITGE